MKPIGTNDEVLGGTAVEETAPGSQRPDASRTRSRQSARFEDIVGANSRAAVSVPAEIEPHAEFFELLKAATASDRSFADGLCSSAALLNAHAGFDFVGQIVFTPTGTELQPLAGSVELLSEQVLLEIATIHGSAGKDPRVMSSAIEGHATRLVGFSAQPKAASRSLLEAAAARLSVRILHSTLQRTAVEVEHTAAMIELLSAISGSKDDGAAAERIANELCPYLKATRVYVGVCPTERTICQLAAVSETEFDSQSELAQRVETVLQESIARTAASQWPTTDPNNRHALLSHQQFVEQTDADNVVACPLINNDGKTVGAIVVEFESDQYAASALQFLTAAAGPIASTLHSIRESSQSLSERMRTRIRRTIGGQTLSVFAAVAVAVSAVMLIPVDYRVTCEAELQPVKRRFIAAPFDAPLNKCFVEPGDVVQAGQLLAELDGRELRWELAGIRADIGKATKERNTFLSERKSGEAAIARHEIERLQNREAVLLARTKNLEIRSPQAGIVVAGDLKDTEGVPLETGQSLFEIAPLDRMTIEVAVPEDDIRHVTDGMTVRLVLDSAPADVVDAQIERLHPRSEVRDDENVFLAEAVVENTDGRFRPGMKGQAKVSTGSQALGWTLLHKPIAHVIGWLGW